MNFGRFLVELNMKYKWLGGSAGGWQDGDVDNVNPLRGGALPPLD